MVIDESTLTERQLAQVRQVVREEVRVVAEAVAAEVISNRLEGLPTTQQIGDMFEKWLSQMHEMVNGTDAHLRRIETRMPDMSRILTDIQLLTVAMNARNDQAEKFEQRIGEMDKTLDQQRTAQIRQGGKIESLETALYGDPNKPDAPLPLFREIRENRTEAVKRHEEVLGLLKQQNEVMARQSERLINVEVFIQKQRAWLKRGQDAIQYLAQNPRLWTGIILGGGTLTAVLVKIVEVMTHWLH